jgi:hypothetical protein
MNKNEKAGYGRHRSGSNQNYFASGKNKGFDLSDYRQNRNSGQCRKCRSDYMKHSRDGLCQDCLQRVEFIMRERPQVAQEVRNQRRGVTV